MAKSELGSGPLSRIGRVEAAIITHLKTEGDPTQRPQQREPEEPIRLDWRQKARLLRIFRDMPDTPEGVSKDDLPTDGVIPDWAQH